jgi:rubrerythrin
MTLTAYASYEPPSQPVQPFAEAQELFCSGCGYGIVVRHTPPRCPMCRGIDWSPRPRVARWN